MKNMGVRAICSVFMTILILCGSEGVDAKKPQQDTDIINQLLSEVRDLKQKYDNLKQSLERTEQEKIVHEKKLIHLSIELQDLKSRHTELEHQQAKTTKELQDVQYKYIELKHGHAKTVSKLQKMKDKYNKSSRDQNKTSTAQMDFRSNAAQQDTEESRGPLNGNFKQPVIINGSMTRRSRQKTELYAENAVGFSAKITRDLSNLGRDQILIFNTVITNIGNSYNPVTGIFTCKYAGMYMFFSNVLAYPEKNVETEIVKNGNNVIYIYSGNHIYFGNGCNMAILQLNEGDTVWIRIHGDYHTTGTEIDRSFTSFSGVLIN